MHHLTRVFLLVTVTVAFASAASAQGHRVLPVEYWTYDYIQRLQQRGHLLDLDPTRLPYRHGDVVSAVNRVNVDALSEKEWQWLDLVYESVSDERPARDDLLWEVNVQPGLTSSTSRRMDPLRPIGDAYPVVPDLSIELYTEANGFFGQVAVRHNYLYVNDVDGLEAARRLKARHEDLYIGYASRLFDVTLGRYSNHWGLARQPGLLISDNPRSYDLLSIRLGGPRLSLTSILGELDNITADDQFTGEAFGPGAKRRFISANRIDWRVTPNFRLSLLESILYSGEGAHVSLRYLNPLRRAFFSVASQPMNDDVKGLITAMAWYNTRNVTMYGQFLVDDIDILGHGNEPSSLAFTGNVHAADIAGDLSIGLMGEFVTARTYNTHVAEGQYIYLLRGLATQFSDYIHVSPYVEYDVTPGITLRPRMHMLWQGEQDMRNVPFPTTIDQAATILDGTVERTIRPALQIDVQRNASWWLRADFGANLITNEAHVEGLNRTRFSALVSTGMRFGAGGVLDLGF
jgi:hypothetical protein